MPCAPWASFSSNHFLSFGNFLRRLAVALASTFLYAGVYLLCAAVEQGYSLQWQSQVWFSSRPTTSFLKVLRYIPGITAFLGKRRGNILEEALAYILSSSSTSTPSPLLSYSLFIPLSLSLSSLSLEGRVFLCRQLPRRRYEHGDL